MFSLGLGSTIQKGRFSTLFTNLPPRPMNNQQAPGSKMSRLKAKSSGIFWLFRGSGGFPTLKAIGLEVSWLWSGVYILRLYIYFLLISHYLTWRAEVLSGVIKKLMRYAHVLAESSSNDLSPIVYHRCPCCYSRSYPPPPGRSTSPFRTSFRAPLVLFFHF